MIQLHDIASANRPANDTSEKDAALALVSDVAQEINSIVERRALRKIDMFLMPAMLIGELILWTKTQKFSVRGSG